MWGDRDRFFDAGVYLPGEQRFDHFYACMDLQEVPQVRNHPARRWQGLWTQLISEAMTSESRAWLISDETLAGSTAGQADRALRDLASCDVHVIFTLRELGGLLIAAWQQHVRERGADRFEDWLDAVASDPDHRFWWFHDPEHVTRRWSVPPERTHVVTVPQTTTRPDELWSRYARVLGVDGDGWEIAGRVNPSLRDVEVELMRRIQERIVPGTPGPWQRRLTKDVIGKRVLTESTRGEPIRMPHRFHGWVEEQQARQVDFLRGSGIDVVGSIDDLTVRPERFGESDEPDVELMLDAALDVIERLVRRSSRIDREIAAERRREAPG